MAEGGGREGWDQEDLRGRDGEQEARPQDQAPAPEKREEREAATAPGKRGGEREGAAEEISGPGRKKGLCTV
jgi:hypothetical protein